MFWIFCIGAIICTQQGVLCLLNAGFCSYVFKEQWDIIEAYIDVSNICLNLYLHVYECVNMKYWKACIDHM